MKTKQMIVCIKEEVKEVKRRGGSTQLMWLEVLP